MADEYDIKAIKARLAEKLEEAGISMRAASNNAGFGNGYVQHLLTSEAEPSVTKLAAVCRENGLSFAYVLLGLSMSPQTERLLQLIERHPEKLDSVLVLLGE
jgi:transcriptional regulator with XRE-family HTH domain